MKSANFPNVSRLALPFALAVLVLGACTPQAGKKSEPVYNWPYPDKPAPSGPQATGTGPAESQNAPSVIASLPPAEPLPDYPRSAEQISGTAVAALIRQARSAREANQPEQAQAKLERALKIEPRNYFAWSELAATYLEQKNYEQAVSVAGKANSLARGNIYVELDNYRVIQEARQALGDSDAAFQAKARADEIEQRLQQADPARNKP